MAIVLSVICAAVYGASDFCGGLASRRMATLGVVVASQGIGFVLLLALMPAFGGTPHLGDWLWGALCGIAGAGAILLLYRGLAIGTMGIVSPVTAVLAAAVPVAFGILARHERPSWLAAAGIVAALVAVVCVSAAPGESPAPSESPGPGESPATAQRGPRTAGRLPPGLIEALVAGVCFGAFFIALAQTRAQAGMYPVLSARLTSLLLLGLGSVAAGRTAQLRIPRTSLALVALCGALDMSANVLFVLAARSGGMLSIVAVLTSLYPASTIALAGIVLGERLAPLQWTGVAMALAGVAAISAAR